MERQEAAGAAKAAVLQRSAEEGWSDLAAGRFDDADDESLDDLVGQLGRRTAQNPPAG